MKFRKIEAILDRQLQTVYLNSNEIIQQLNMRQQLIGRNTSSTEMIGRLGLSIGPSQTSYLTLVPHLVTIHIICMFTSLHNRAKLTSQIKFHYELFIDFVVPNLDNVLESRNQGQHCCLWITVSNSKGKQLLSVANWNLESSELLHNCCRPFLSRKNGYEAL